MTHTARLQDLPDPRFRELSSTDLAECLASFDEYLEEQLRLLDAGVRFARELNHCNPDSSPLADALASLKRAKAAAQDARAAFRMGIGFYAREAKEQRAKNPYGRQYPTALQVLPGGAATPRSSPNSGASTSSTSPPTTPEESCD